MHRLYRFHTLLAHVTLNNLSLKLFSYAYQMYVLLSYMANKVLYKSCSAVCSHNIVEHEIHVKAKGKKNNKFLLFLFLSNNPIIRSVENQEIRGFIRNDSTTTKNYMQVVDACECLIFHYHIILFSYPRENQSINRYCFSINSGTSYPKSQCLYLYTSHQKSYPINQVNT